MANKKYPLLSTLLKGHCKDEVIKWEYYGYGFFDKGGECKISEIPRPVMCSRCFEHDDTTYKVDGAL
ncbi:MAG: hypothetical protein NC218_02015 [Acetobacter sp.]|nr:hypothetical protein [Acetobacter sp.]